MILTRKVQIYPVGDKEEVWINGLHSINGEMKMDKELEEISKVVESDLKKNYIKNMIQGFETANKMILDKINSGATLEEVKKIVELNLKNKKVVEKVAMGKKG